MVGHCLPLIDRYFFLLEFLILLKKSPQNLLLTYIVYVIHLLHAIPGETDDPEGFQDKTCERSVKWNEGKLQIIFHHVSFISPLPLPLLYCQVIKLYAWEIPFKQQIMGIRQGELNVLRSTAFLNAGSSFTWTCAPFLVSCGCSHHLQTRSGVVYSILK